MMTDELSVKAKADKDNNVVVLTVDYGPDLMFRGDAFGKGNDALANAYVETTQKEHDPPACIVIIDAETAGSKLIRALYQLWNSSPRGRQCGDLRSIPNCVH